MNFDSITISDSGRGIPPSKLKLLRASLYDDSDSEKHITLFRATSYFSLFEVKKSDKRKMQEEMGTLKSIGMTNKQLEQSFMIEGLFNTGISLFMTIIIGIPGGYMIGTFLEKAGMSTGFVFPTRAFLLFVTVMLLLEVLMTILLIHSWKKQSVIEIMRN